MRPSASAALRRTSTSGSARDRQSSGTAAAAGGPMFARAAADRRLVVISVSRKKPRGAGGVGTWLDPAQSVGGTAADPRLPIIDQLVEQWEEGFQRRRSHVPEGKSGCLTNRRINIVQSMHELRHGGTRCGSDPPQG